jgi:hypothetical protein
MINFKAKTWKIGVSTVITIPKKLIDNQILETNKEYEIEFKTEEQKETEIKN